MSCLCRLTPTRVTGTCAFELVRWHGASKTTYTQPSAIYTPADAEFARDAIAAECNPNIETLIIHDVDTELLRRHKSSGSVQNWNDRRRDVYKVVYNDDGAEHEV